MSQWRYKASIMAPKGMVDYISRDVREDPSWMGEDLAHPIDKIEFFLPINQSIVMSGMDAYNFFAECVQGMNGGSKGACAFYLCGRHGGMVNVWRIGGGKIIHQDVPFGTEYDGRPTAGWKAGNPGNPISTLVGRIMWR